ncbi:LAFA_0F17744g1_1 [Lachancea sp. 'fantastica']|nr:LAFA_0F17744g1_1 [Lachancea sp. 'fantastica']
MTQKNDDPSDFERLTIQFSNAISSLASSIGVEPFIDVACTFFELIVSLCPEKCFQQLLKEDCSGRRALELELEKEITSHPELDLEVDPRFLMKSISRTRLYDRHTLELKIKLVIVSKTVIAFLDFFDKEYAEAFFKFRWTLQFLHECRRIIGICDVPIAASLDYERSLSLLCAKALVKGFGGLRATKTKIATEFKVNRLDIFEGLLANILDCTEPSILTCGDDLDHFMMDEMFTVLGRMEECIAFLRGPLCEVEETSSPRIYAIRPQQTHLDGMIRKFILASTFKLSGDPSILLCFDKILEGIMFYGGVHSYVVAFFRELKLYHRDEFPKCGLSSGLLVKTRSSLAALVNKFADQGCSRGTSSVGSKHPRCPYVLIKINDERPIVVDALHEPSGKHNHEITLLLSTAKLKAKRKIHGDQESEVQTLGDQWEKGLSWVHFWHHCYLDNKGSVPHKLTTLLSAVYEWDALSL